MICRKMRTINTVMRGLCFRFIQRASHLVYLFLDRHRHTGCVYCSPQFSILPLNSRNARSPCTFFRIPEVGATEGDGCDYEEEDAHHARSCDPDRDESISPGHSPLG